ncbi:hypothetical protein K502DRAFT_365790 [Neoconidiobolus thromboides FSU 785]|nr:hypothetical protein K502DRAFT_365790 [Neoconidiobolus thromboides FSU 785]
MSSKEPTESLLVRFKRLLFIDVFQLLKVYRQRNDPNLDLIKLKVQDTSKYNGQRLDKAWREQFEKKDKVPSLKKVFYNVFAKEYLFLGIWKIFWIILTYLGCYVLLKFLIIRVQFNKLANDPNTEGNSKDYFAFFPYISYGAGHAVALSLFVSCSLASICIHHLKSECTRVGIQVRSSIMVLVYRKSLRIHSVSGQISDIVELVGDDCNSIAEAFVNYHSLWSSVVEIIIIIALSFVELGLAALPVLGILVIIFPVQYMLGQYAAKLSQKRSKTTSERVHLMSEVLTAIKLVKFYAWEAHFKERISNVRKQEISQLRTEFFIRSSLMVVMFGAPVLATLASLQVYRMLYPDNFIQAEMVFALVSIFNTLRYPLYLLPISIQTTRASLSSFKNLEKYLSRPEVQPLASTFTVREESTEDDSSPLLELDSASFSWSVDAKPVLSDLSLKIHKGQIFAVVGDVGAGKSSILSALMGQMVLKGGDVYLKPDVRMGYCPSEPWILSAGLRDNVVFGSKFDSDKYRKIVKACALNRDFKALTNGDRTEIGERGYNLTLGQRHRVSMARAVYNDSDIILMDDPLSPMDPRVAKHIFKECIQGLLKDKAVIFVTNQLHFLPYCHHIFVMRSGKCTEQGKYEELMASDIDFAALVGESIEIEDPNGIDDVLGDDFLLSDLPNNENQRNSPEVLSSSNDNGNGYTNKPLIKIVENSGRAVNHNFMPKAENSKKEDQVEENDNETKEGNEKTFMPSVSFSRTNTIEKGNPLATQAELNEITVSRMLERADMSGHNEIVSKIIDKTQMSVIGGAGLAINTSTVQTENNALARAMERNQLTIHSLHYQDNPDEDDYLDEEERVKARRKLRRKLYLKYFKEGYGLTLTLITVIFSLFVHAIRIYNDYWLTVTIDSNKPFSELGHDLDVYSYIAVAFIVGVFIRGIALISVSVSKSNSFHKNMLLPIISAPMSYFEFTPLSRILHSFARHLHIADEVMWDSSFQALQFFPLVLGTFLIACIVVPFLFIPGILLIGAAIFIMWYGKGVEDKLQLYEASSRPPMFSHLSATLEGLHSIRIYKVQSRFDAFNMVKIDQSNKALLALTLVKCWTSLYIDLLSSLFIYFAALLLLALEDNYTLTKGDTGLALTNALQLLLFGHMTAQSILDFHSSIWSVDQLVHYRSSIIPEGSTSLDDIKPPENWPENGTIEFKDVSLRYHRYEISVLKNVSFVIQGRSKVGIVGSTGSGKTTLLTSLLRLVEVADGAIEIDSVDISHLELFELRSKIAVIPQEPVLFYGTIRSNLDPNNLHTDHNIWHALESVHLAEKVRSMKLQLDAPIVENGTVFTFAQRQLFCVARAILLNCKILILDEATSAVDLHTEGFIRDVINKNFANHTVMFVGHRLNSIIEADKVLVMDKGKVVEYDAPERLLNNPNGHLYSLILQNGEVAVQNLLNLAIQKAGQRDSRVSEVPNITPSGISTPARSIKQPQLATNNSGTSTPKYDNSVNPQLTVISTLSHQTVNSQHLPPPAEMPRSLEEMFLNPNVENPNIDSVLRKSEIDSLSNSNDPK